MMKVNVINNFLLFVVLMIFSSCSTEDLKSLIGSPIQLTASSQAVTRFANTDYQTSLFEQGALIKAYISADNGNINIGNPTILTAEAPSGGVNRLTPDVQPYYPNSNVTVDIHALYPAEKVTSGSELFSFVVEEDQSLKSNYANSDLMYAEQKNIVRSSNDVNLDFTHKMAKIIVTATGEEGVVVTGIQLIGLSRSIQIDPTTGTLCNLGEQNEAIIMDNGGAILLPPQTINGDFIKVTVTTDGGNTHELATFSLTNKQFEGGKEYSASVTITRQRIGFTTSITDWTADMGTTALVPGSSSNMEIDDVSPQTYTGTEIEPAPDIYWVVGENKTLLTRGVDYQLTYFANKNAGTGTIIITGMSTSAIETVRKVTAVKTFTIKQATGKLSYEHPTPNDNEYYEEAYVINGTVSNMLSKMNDDNIEGDGTITYTSSNTAVARVSQLTGAVTKVGVGEATITASMAGDRNFTSTSTSYRLKITPRQTSNFKISLSSNSFTGDKTFTYNGRPQTPTVTVVDTDASGEDIPRIQNIHYTLSVSGNTDAGEVTVNVNGIGNYAGTNSTQKYSIAQATPNITPNYENITLAVGSEILRPVSSDMGMVVITSSDDSKVKVSQAGEIKALAVTTTPVTITAKVTTDNKNYLTAQKTYNVTVVNPNQTFDYSGSVQTWTCHVAGTYKLEVWGAAGADAIDITPYNTTSRFVGGKGAYVAGTIRISEAQVNSGLTLYVYVGGQGMAGGTTGGWNGGGQLKGTNLGSGYNYSGGGGATDISLNGGNWDSSTHLNSRIIVAGGGGGALVVADIDAFANGGGAGAFEGIAGNGTAPGGGGKLNAGGASGGTNGSAGSFGKGGDYSGSGSVGMGGGGWYGGGSGGDNANHGAGGGGSSYIWSSANAKYYPGTKPSTAYYITELSKTANTRSGNGMAKITYISAD